MPVAKVVVDIPARQIDRAFDYTVPTHIGPLEVGTCVLVPFGPRPAVGYVVDVLDEDRQGLRDVDAVLGGPFFRAHAAPLARWIADEYLSPLSEALRLFTPPGGTPRAVRTDSGWTLKRPHAGPVDDRWVELTAAARDFVPPPRATMQRAVLDALRAGPVRVAELAADLGNVDGALRRLSQLGVVTVERRRRYRDVAVSVREAPRHESLTAGQQAALSAIHTSAPGSVILLDGVTGSGKTEVYLRAIEEERSAGRSSIVLVPEISLTPQTVGRFRSRFGDAVAVLHSRLSDGERYDQWERILSRQADVVVGARSALFAPVDDLGLIIIDEEHEGSYKQASSPRYHAREVAARLAELVGARLVLGSATSSVESRYACDTGRWVRVALPQRAREQPLPTVEVVDMAAEFESGNRSMFSRPLSAALNDAAASGSKAVLLLNRRGFASFLLCRECGHVPSCDSCSTSLTYHEVGRRLACHHCGLRRQVPATCPQCGSVYLRQFGTGTQRVEAELALTLPDVPVIRMDADTTAGKGGHERALAAFEGIDGAAVLLGTQMIAKGLDYPDVTVVGVVNADTTLHLPDFRASERTYQLLEQVAGRAGRGDTPGRVVIQTYWPDHPAIVAAATHDPEPYLQAELSLRESAGYPPFRRLVNVLVWGRELSQVRTAAEAVFAALAERATEGTRLLGPSPAPLARLKGVHRWHVFVKLEPEARAAEVVGPALSGVKAPRGVTIAPDIDPFDLL